MELWFGIRPDVRQGTSDSVRTSRNLELGPRHVSMLKTWLYNVSKSSLIFSVDLSYKNIYNVHYVVETIICACDWRTGS